MNRGTAADKYEAFRDVHITGCSSFNTGINGTHGFFVTLDGTGSGFEIRNNYVRKASVTGIENTGWINGVIDNNTFGDFSRSYKPLSNSTVNDIMTGVTISNNRTLVPAPLASVFYDMNQCVIENNRIEVDGDGAAAFVRDANDNRFRNNIWRNLNTTATGFYALLISSATRNCHRNVFVDETFDHSTVGNGFAALRFSGANCKFNSVIRPRVALAAAGQFFDQTSSADENWVQHMYRFQNNDLWNVEHVTRNFTSDANITLIIVDYSARIIQMTDTGVLLTAGRDVILPKFERTWVVRNGTAQILTFKASTGTGIAVAAGNVATIYWDGTNMKRATADVVA